MKCVDAVKQGVLALNSVVFSCVAVASIFSLPNIQLSKDPGYRSGFPKTGFISKTRRQSMLL